MSRKEKMLGVLIFIALVCAFHIGLSTGKIQYQNTDNSQAFVFGYMLGTRNTAQLIDEHQRNGRLFPAAIIPQVVLDAATRNSTLRGFHEDMAILDSLDFGLFPEMQY